MRGFVAALAVLILAGCGSDYAGLKRSDAITLSEEVARGFPPVRDDFIAHPRRAERVGIYRSTMLSGERAWLSIFRFRGEDVLDPDQACVWVAAGPYGAYRTEQAPTIAHGRATPLHERCLDEVQAHGFFDREQSAGDESPRPSVAFPVAISPLGPVSPVGYRTEWGELGSAWLAPYALRYPATTAPGTWGLAGFVTDTEGDVVPGALIQVWPAKAARRAVSARADGKGAFAFVNLPIARSYDVVVSATGFLADRSTQEVYANEIFLWEIGLRRHGQR